MNDVRNTSPRRYVVDGVGRRVLVGLSVEETSEFEQLDGLSSLTANTREAAAIEARWIKLYAKHDQAWLRWMDERRQTEETPPSLSINAFTRP